MKNIVKEFQSYDLMCNHKMNDDCLSMVLMMTHYDKVINNIDTSGIYLANEYFYKLLGNRDYGKEFGMVFRNYYCFTKKRDYCKVYSMCKFIDRNKSSGSVCSMLIHGKKLCGNIKDEINWLRNLYVDTYKFEFMVLNLKFVDYVPLKFFFNEFGAKV